jgi:hypothetical protein
MPDFPGKCMANVGRCPHPSALPVDPVTLVTSSLSQHYDRKPLTWLQLGLPLKQSLLLRQLNVSPYIKSYLNHLQSIA